MEKNSIVQEAERKELLKKLAARRRYMGIQESERDGAIRKKIRKNPFFSISSLTNSGLEKIARVGRPLLTQGWKRVTSGPGRARGATGLAPFSIVLVSAAVRRPRRSASSAARASERLFLDRTHFSAEKTRGACARPRWGCSSRRLRRRGRHRVLLVGAASSRGARVRPSPQESVAALKFSTKKLVVARPRLKEVSLPLSLRPLARADPREPADASPARVRRSRRRMSPTTSS